MRCVIPIVLSIAGSDSSGGAGIQADLKAIVANGGYAATAITAITAQNTREVRAAEPLRPELVREQIEAVFDDLNVAAVKTGMLANGEIVEVVARALAERSVRRLVCDPVMISKTGHALLAAEAVTALRERLLPLATLVTPNVHEAQTLAGIEVRSASDAEAAGRRILECGARAVLVKGGHLAGRPAADVLVTPDEVRWYEAEPIDTPHTHGTGCTYAAAIATQLARGRTLGEAVSVAKRFVTEAIRHGRAVGGGHGPTEPFFRLAPFPEEGETS